VCVCGEEVGDDTYHAQKDDGTVEYVGWTGHIAIEAQHIYFCRHLSDPNERERILYEGPQVAIAVVVVNIRGEEVGLDGEEDAVEYQHGVDHDLEVRMHYELA